MLSSALHRRIQLEFLCYWTLESGWLQLPVFHQEVTEFVSRIAKTSSESVLRSAILIKLSTDSTTLVATAMPLPIKLAIAIGVAAIVHYVFGSTEYLLETALFFLFVSCHILLMDWQARQPGLRNAPDWSRPMAVLGPLCAAMAVIVFQVLFSRLGHVSRFSPVVSSTLGVVLLTFLVPRINVLLQVAFFAILWPVAWYLLVSWAMSGV